MSRMNTIRSLATSGAASAAIGGTVGGVGAHYSGQDTMSGIGYGAAAGAGGRLGTSLLGKAAGSMKLGLKGPISQGMRNLEKPGMRNKTRGMIGAYGAAGSTYKKMKNIGPVKAGIAGGAAGLGFTTLAANQGFNTTMRNATLNQRLGYENQRGLNASNIRLRESMMKKQMWQPGAY